MYIISVKKRGIPDSIKRFSDKQKAEKYLKKLKQNGENAYLTKV